MLFKLNYGRSCHFLLHFFSFHSFNSFGGIVLFLSSSIVPLVKFLLYSIHVQPECYLNFLVLIPCPYRLMGVVSMSLSSLGSRRIPCFLILPESLNLVRLRCTLSSKFFNLSRFFGFTHLSNKQLCFSNPLPSRS